MDGVSDFPLFPQAQDLFFTFSYDGDPDAGRELRHFEGDDPLSGLSAFDIALASRRSDSDPARLLDFPARLNIHDRYGAQIKPYALYDFSGGYKDDGIEKFHIRTRLEMHHSEAAHGDAQGLLPARKKLGFDTGNQPPHRSGGNEGVVQGSSPSSSSPIVAWVGEPPDASGALAARLASADQSR